MRRKAIATAPEMVVAVSIGWCAAVAALAGALNLSGYDARAAAIVAAISASLWAADINPASNWDGAR